MLKCFNADTLPLVTHHRINLYRFMRESNEPYQPDCPIGLVLSSQKILSVAIWNNLPYSVVKTPKLNSFKKRLED